MRNDTAERYSLAAADPTWDIGEYNVPYDITAARAAEFFISKEGSKQRGAVGQIAIISGAFVLALGVGTSARDMAKLAAVC